MGALKMDFTGIIGLMGPFVPRFLRAKTALLPNFNMLLGFKGVNYAQAKFLEILVDKRGEEKPKPDKNDSMVIGGDSLKAWNLGINFL